MKKIVKKNLTFLFKESGASKYNLFTITILIINDTFFET